MSKRLLFCAYSGCIEHQKHTLDLPFRVVGIRLVVDLDAARLSIDINDVLPVLLLLLAVLRAASHHHLDAVSASIIALICHHSDFRFVSLSP